MIYYPFFHCISRPTGSMLSSLSQATSLSSHRAENTADIHQGLAWIRSSRPMSSPECMRWLQGSFSEDTVVRLGKEVRVGPLLRQPLDKIPEMSQPYQEGEFHWSCPPRNYRNNRAPARDQSIWNPSLTNRNQILRILPCRKISSYPGGSRHEWRGAASHRKWFGSEHIGSR